MRRNTRRSCLLECLLPPLTAVAVLLAAATVAASDFDVVINEIHYNPVSGLAQDEYVELYNRGGTEVDLTDWALTEGVHLIFPAGTIIGPKSYLLVSPDAARARQRYGVEAVTGDFTGRFDDSGEIVHLMSSRNETICRLHYKDGGAWPRQADGLGPSIELNDPFSDVELARNWVASRFIDGTPGAQNSTAVISAPIGGGEDIVLLPRGATWRYRKGTSAHPAAWMQPGFDDGAWESGPTGIGFGDGDDATELTDMPGNYLSFAARHRFSITQDELDAVGEVFLLLDFDDGFVAWWNGEEIARVGLGEPGAAVDFDQPSGVSHEAGTVETFTVPRGLVTAGDNVLAVAIHNNGIQSGDASFIPEVIGRPATSTGGGGQEIAPPILINEIKPTEAAGAGFIELYNAGAAAIDVSGWRVVDSLGNEHAIAAGAPLAAGARRVLSDAQLGFPTRLAGATYMLLDTALKLVDAVNPSPGLLGENGFSFGRVPDGDEDGFVLRAPSAGTPNQVALPDGIVINEIFYHPPFVPPSGDCTRDCSDADQWIELHNRGAAAVDVSGWSLTSGVAFTLPAATSIGAGGYLVIAASRARFLDTHPGFQANRVLGDWSRSLSHGSETINLRDALGNAVDHVEYGDGGPLDDVAPENGADDGTFRGSEWPPEADSGGRTLELIHPRLDNRLGGAWGTGPAGGTPGAANSSFLAAPAAAVGDVTHAPPVPRSTEPVRVVCRVSAVGALASVTAVWRTDGGGPSGNATLRDDGLSGDGLAGDGIFAGTIPPQPNNAIIAFQIEARLADNTLTRVPSPPRVEPYNGFEGPFYLYQVLNAAPPSNPSPNYYIIMTDRDLQELEDRPLQSDALLPATFIALPGLAGRSSPVVRHVVGLRYRGAQTRNATPSPYRIEFAAERDFHGMEDLNLNSASIDTEILAADLFRRAGMPAPEEWTVNVTFRGATSSRYVRKEQLDDEFLNRFFGDSSDHGNFYRAFDPDNNGQFPFQGDLTYRGEDPESYRAYYGKRTNAEADDYSDIVELCRAFDPVETPADVFPERIEALIDVWQWARFFAVQACITNNDGGIQSGTGEDYFLYRVPADSPRLDAGKWILVPWDIEETYNDDEEPLFRPDIRAIRRFLTHPRYAPLYYCNLRSVREGAFSRRETRQRFQLISFLFNFTTIDGIDAYITARLGFFDLEVPIRLTTGANDGTSQGGARLVSEGDEWRFFRGTQAPPGGGLAWTGRLYDDAAWEQGISGFGYDDGDDATVIDDMEDNYTSLYIRRRFTVQNAAAIPGLTLSVDYDDGFVAYLNGREVARRDVAGPVDVPVPFDDVASAAREAGTAETIDISAFLGELRDGENVLALHGFNRTIDSSDFSLIPELFVGGQLTGSLGCGELVYTTDAVVNLAGRSNACDTRSVRVDGVEAAYDTFLAQWSGAAAVDLGINTVTVEAFDAFGERIDVFQITVERLPGGLREVAGTLAADTVWTAAGGPYQMTSSVTVPAGRKLTIDPGTIIFASGDASIVVRGELEAIGAADDPILFRSALCNDRWGGIFIDGTGTGGNDPTPVLRYCDFSWGNQPQGASGFIGVNQGKVLVDRCVFTDITANAVDGIGARLEVRDSSFDRILEGVHGTNSLVVIVGCHFNGMTGDKDAIDFDGNGTSGVRSRIEGCLITNGSDDGIDLGNTSVDIRDNIFVNVQDKALSLEQNGPLGAPTITGNLIVNCGTGIALKNGVTIAEGHHNTLVGNQEGMNLFAKAGASDGGHGAFHSMIIWDNAIDVKLDPLSSITFTQSNISGGTPWPGEGNISMDPRFVDVKTLDFALRSSSPCIGTGRDESDMGAVPFTGSLATFVRADIDSSGGLSLTDAVGIMEFLFRGGAPPACHDRMDANDDAQVDVSDGVYTLLYLFAQGAPPPAPFPAPGIDETPDTLPCEG